MYYSLNFAKNTVMKTNKLNSLLLSLAIAALFAACSGGGQQESTSEEASEETASTDASATFAVNAGDSEVAWKGEVAGVYGHNGIINVQEGSISVAGGKVTGGEVVIDMTSIQPLDSASYSEENSAQDLVNHLSTGDFFLVEEFPTASFVIKSHNENQLVGDLTIRGITSEETVDLSSLEISESGLVGAGTLVFDRQKYDVKWEHYVQDYILSDDISLTLSISAGN